MSMHLPGVPINILMIDAQPDHASITGRALKEFKFKNRLHMISKEVEAIAYLRRAAPYQDAPVPHLIFLDVSLPNKLNFQLMKELKTEADLRQIPLIILACSEAECEFVKGYSVEFKHCMIKPMDEKKLLQVVKSIDTFSLSILHTSQDM